MTEHKWAHILRAIADGKEVQYRSVICTAWKKGNGNVNPITDTGYEWRIKPTEQEKPMPTPAKLPHIHAANMAEYAQDAAIDGEAWKNWEYLVKGREQWHDLRRDPSWDPDCQYRRRPRAIKMLKVTTNSGRVLEFPEPLRVAPAKGAKYFLIVPGCVVSSQWGDDTPDWERLNRLVCHLTRESAEKHAAALLAVNRGE